MNETKEQKELRLLRHYVYHYGNAQGACEYGYPQHPGWICGLCQADSTSECKNKSPVDVPNIAP